MHLVADQVAHWEHHLWPHQPWLGFKLVFLLLLRTYPVFLIPVRSGWWWPCCCFVVAARVDAVLL